ncbi:glucuronoxylan 4-O-methyltransferase 1 [Tripterygium wilfordii]|uniref:Glucuronoxylan 4-O-methyltransferase 1 n=1 Tax=Tripterygium wilfordii TaxID=458696 RepID=A0A7J7CDK6_TRIWF|nr:glucuronoxylan 4-O-methyltransferase 1 [Tripterygium wilfordii]KAF5732219.1 glucuronoxylan 4-O-methyltransferase 1 [Tripterygium wilfordii]
MPPQVPQCLPLVTHCVPFSPPVTPVANKYFQGTKRMRVSGKKFIPLLVFVLSSFSIVRLLKIVITTSSSYHPLPVSSTTLQQKCSAPSPACGNHTSYGANTSKGLPITSVSSATLTKKEFQLIQNLISRKAPCNLLIFGFSTQYLTLSSINLGGKTIILEDDLNKISKIKTKFNSTRIYKVDHKAPAKEAYKLLKIARHDPACAPRSVKLQESTCELALKNLPREVYDIQWDLVVVDGPEGNTPEAPGRMAAIYTASMMARAGNTTTVLVHDVNRMVEKWFSWEFLCDDNLASSKGKLWEFRINGRTNSTRFCST